MARPRTMPPPTQALAHQQPVRVPALQSYSTERSISDEIARESTADIPTVVLSYLVMVAYISLFLPLPRLPSQPTRSATSPPAFAGPNGADAGSSALSGAPSASASEQAPSSGRFRHLCDALARAPPRMSFTVGVGGVAVVAASVLSSLGILGWAGAPVSLITLEVSPFVALAIGVDNMFIICEEFSLQDRLLPLPHRISKALESSGPSIATAAACEALAFLAGALSPMPAVKTFALASALTVALNFALQASHRGAPLRLPCTPFAHITAHHASSSRLMHALNPPENRRICAVGSPALSPGRLNHPAWLIADALQITAFVALLAVDATWRESAPHSDASLSLVGQRSQQAPLPGSVVARPRPEQGLDMDHVLENIDGAPGGIVKDFMGGFFADVLLRPAVQVAVLSAFLGTALLSITVAPFVEHGLDQTTALVSA